MFTESGDVFFMGQASGGSDELAVSINLTLFTFPEFQLDSGIPRDEILPALLASSEVLEDPLVPFDFAFLDANPLELYSEEANRGSFTN